MGYFSDLFKSKETIEAELRDMLARERKAQLDKDEVDAIAHATAAAERAVNDERLRMESPVPWYELIGNPYDMESPPIEPINERYRWNKAFVTHLREQGYSGEYDYVVIGNWERDIEEKRVGRLLEIQREQIKASAEPWCEIISDGYDVETKQIFVKLDWNAAFIKMLRGSGYTGRDEQELVDKWFKRISGDIASDLHSAKYDG
jgi:hypothetical protein